MNMICAKCGAVIPDNYKHYEVTANCVKDSNLKFVRHYYIHGDCWNQLSLLSNEERTKFREDLYNGKI